MVILGGGFAGLAAARAIGEDADVTMIDRTPDFEFLPSLHEIVSRRQSAKSVSLPRAKILKRLGQSLVESDAQRIDLSAKTVETKEGTVPYDALIIATGGEIDLGKVPGAAEHAVPFRSAAHAEQIARRLSSLADAKVPARVVIVGGGLTGVEVLGEILRRYRDKRHLDLALVESNATLLPGWPKALQRRVRKLAKREGVELIHGARVSQVEADWIGLDNGRRLASALTIWATSPGPPAVLAASGLGSSLVGAKARGLVVNSGLSLATHPDVFVAGDAAAPPQRVKKQAAQALLLGQRAGRNALRYLSGRAPKGFTKESLPVLLTFGDLSSFVVFDDDTALEGAVLGAGRDLSFQASMAELDRLDAKGSLARLERRLRHNKTVDRFALSPHELLGGLAGLRLHRP